MYCYGYFVSSRRVVSIYYFAWVCIFVLHEEEANKNSKRALDWQFFFSNFMFGTHRYVSTHPRWPPLSLVVLMPKKNTKIIAQRVIFGQEPCVDNAIIIVGERMSVDRVDLVILRNLYQVDLVILRRRLMFLLQSSFLPYQKGPLGPVSKRYNGKSFCRIYSFARYVRMDSIEKKYYFFCFSKQQMRQTLCSTFLEHFRPVCVFCVEWHNPNF